MTDANGSTHTTAFTYDGLDRLVTTTYPDTSAETATYDADGNVLTHTTRASATLHYGYDTLNRLVTKTAGATPVACDATPSATPTVSYRYDLAGRLIGVCDNSTAIQPITGMAGSAVYTTSTGYDALSHPTNVAYSPVPTALSPTLASPVVFTHAYNAVNQRVGQTVSDNAWISYPSGPTATTGYTANTLNQYTCVGVTAPSCTGVVPTYDGNGNLTSDGTYTLGYDAENRLTSATASGLTAAYAYDARGRRKAKTVNGTTTVFVTDADNREVLEYDGSTGAVLRWYAYGMGPNDVLAQTTPGTTPSRVTFIPDLQGSIIGSMSTAGVLTSFSYKPYGGSASPPGQFAYTGQRIDLETGLYYYRARYYHPTWGRFAQSDPADYASGPHLYAYVQNDPLNFTDFTGLWADVQVKGNMVTINIPIQFKGSGLTLERQVAIVAGIQNTWTGSFNGYQVTTNVVVPTADTPSRHINTFTVLDRAGVSITNAVGGNNVTIYTAYAGSTPYDFSTLGLVGAHEAGHVMGLPDYYDPRTNVPNPGHDQDLMGTLSGLPTGQDIQTIIQCSTANCYRGGLFGIFSPEAPGSASATSDSNSSGPAK